MQTESAKGDPNFNGVQTTSAYVRLVRTLMNLLKVIDFKIELGLHASETKTFGILTVLATS